MPAHIQMEGFDSPQYTNTQYPWEGREDIRPGEIPEYFNPVASYVKYFTVPEPMKGKRLFISFQGAESALALWMNGTYVGYRADSFTPSDFELTPYVKEGKNKLAVQVFKWTGGSWCEDQDFYRFSGLYRDVFLYTVPEVHIRDLKIRALPDETLKQAVLEASARPGEREARSLLCPTRENSVWKIQKILQGKTPLHGKLTDLISGAQKIPLFMILRSGYMGKTENLWRSFRRKSVSAGLR